MLPRDSFRHASVTKCIGVRLLTDIVFETIYKHNDQNLEHNTYDENLQLNLTTNSYQPL